MKNTMTKMTLRSLAILLACLALLARPANAQTAGGSLEPPRIANISAPPVPALPDVDPAGNAGNLNESKFGRWFDFSKIMLASRYIHAENSSGATTVTQIQHRQDLTGRFKFDAQGSYALHFWVNSGRRFTAGWDETAAGPRRANANLYLKHLFLSLRPVKGVEVQYGSFDFLRGQNTEITSYNNDGYLTGQRLIVRRPKELFFDEIGVTYASFGDLNLPNINKRYHRLTQSNYHQFLLSKNIGKRATISGDYTFVDGAETLRQAVKITTPELKLVDNVRFENYQRLDINRAYGFAVLVEKALTKKWNFIGGYTQVDPKYGNVNADKVFQGKHLYLLTNYNLTDELSFGVFHGHLLEKTSLTLPVRTRTEIVLRFNLLKQLQKALKQPAKPQAVQNARRGVG
jgi:hypothetical protein